MTKAANAFRTISEVAETLDVPKHVLRFWELKFPQIKPMKRGGGRRYYRPEDLDLLRGIRHLLHAEGYTIKGVQRILRERGVDAVKQAPTGAGEVMADGQPAAPDAAVEAKPTKEAARKKSDRAKKPVPGESRTLSEASVKALEKAIDELEACRRLLKEAAQSKAAPAEAGKSGKSKRKATTRAANA